MARFLIEVPHDPERGCVRARCQSVPEERFSLAEWGCRDGNHKAWLIADVDGKDEARQIVPPAFRVRSRNHGFEQIYRRRELTPSSGSVSNEEVRPVARPDLVTLVRWW